MKNRNWLIFLLQLSFSESYLVSNVDIKTMIESMGSSFGAPPVGYTYSFEIWNDASVPMYVEQEGIASFMGAYFPSPKGYFGAKTLPSLFDTNGSVAKATYLHQDYYFKLYIADHTNPHTSPIYKESLTQLPLIKRDPKVYYYHIYTERFFSKGRSVHAPQVELMGYQDPTQLNNPDTKLQGNVKLSVQLSSLSFYNSSGTDVQVSLTYGIDPYTFTIEKYSYNSLDLPTPQEKAASSSSSTTVAVTTTDKKSATASAPVVPPAFSLRPNTLSFAAYNSTMQKYDPFRSLLLPAQGFDGSIYTIEIFQDAGQKLEVGIQGFNPGNYTIATTSRIRDLTPCPCTFWYKSFEQDGSVQGYSNLPGQIWIIYAGKDSQVVSKVTPGQVVSWNLVRPLIEQGDQFVYFVYVVTTDDAIAQKFVQKIATQMLGKNIIQEYTTIMQAKVQESSSLRVDQELNVKDTTTVAPTSITADQQVATLMGNLTIADGVIKDTEQDVIGYIVGTDVFTPKGLGFGRFYYTLTPSMIDFSPFIALVSAYLDTTKTATLGGSSIDVQKSLTTTINSWFAVYMKSSSDAQKHVEQYLIKYGNAKIVDATTGNLTKFGQSRVQAIMSGTISLKYPSMKLSTVTNNYVYDFGKAAPDKMPNAVTKIHASTPIVVATPAGVVTTTKKVILNSTLSTKSTGANKS